MTTISVRTACTVGALAFIIGTASAFAVAQSGAAGLTQSMINGPAPAAAAVFLDHDGTPLTDIRAWNAARATRGPNWRP